MKVLAGRLTDADREILFESNRTGRRVLVAALTVTVTYDQRRATPYTESPMQAVGTVKSWTHDDLEIGGWGFTTVIPWTAAIGVWWRDEAPSEKDVAAILFEASNAA